MIEYSDLIGIPFRNRGRDRETGLDCYGLVQEVYRKSGVDLPEYTADYNDMAGIDRLVKSNTQGYPWKRITEPVAPCLVAIRFGSPPGVVNHTAVYVGAGKFIHTRDKIGVCVDRISNPAWSRVIVGYYQYVGENNGNTGNHKKSI